MSQDQLRAAIDALRARIQAEFEGQLSAIEQQQADALEEARAAARREADVHWTAELERLRSEWAARLDSDLMRASAEADRALKEACERTRAETEEAAAERARLELAAALASARETSEADAARHADELSRLTRDLEAERLHLDELTGTLEADRQRAEELARELESDRQRADELTGALKAERQRADELARALEAEGQRSDELNQRLEDERGRTAASELEVQALRSQQDRDRAAQQEQAEASGRTVRDLSAALDAARQQLEDERGRSQAAAATEKASTAVALTEARATERQAQLAVMSGVLDASRTIAAARSLTDALGALATAAATQASRASVLIVKGSDFHPFMSVGFEEGEPRRMSLADSAALGRAAAERTAISVTSANAPAFAALAPDRAGLAIPIVVGGQAVAVLYADNGGAARPEVPAAWPEVVEILAHQASSTLAQLTAVRTAQAMRLMQSGTGPPRPAARTTPAAQDEAAEAARRYARLLVSEIKLYNEGAVRVGREKRDLLVRLREEVTRARRLYEERVPSSVTARERYFEQELRDILAGGDPALLGNPTVAS